MHQLIYALVEASSEDQALAAAKTTFDGLVGASPTDGAVFDYYVTFDDNSSTVAGKARWGERPVAAPIDSEDGTELVESGWEATVKEFEHNLDRVRDALGELDTEAIMQNKNFVRKACYDLGAYRGPPVFLYEESGTGIRHRDQLDRVLDSDEQVWVVPADVHTESLSGRKNQLLIRYF
ncbi:hypothetical protein [Halorussus lipolyticus]|uniref:hypothetical protein n=1 Tax=Halorussus lipolyticus TaxID=3034024 RepID=UPI0023E7AAA3|nr:hypothetical protein [Halorussus sp. DT80]